MATNANNSAAQNNDANSQTPENTDAAQNNDATGYTPDEQRVLGYINAKSRTMLDEPKQYDAVRVVSATPYRRDGRDIVIVNLSAMTPYGLDRALDLFEAGDLEGAGNQGLSTNVRVTDYVPSVGEYVTVQMGIRQIAEKTDPTTGEVTPATEGLFVIGLSKQAPATPKVVSAADRLAERAKSRQPQNA